LVNAFPSASSGRRRSTVSPPTPATAPATALLALLPLPTPTPCPALLLCKLLYVNFKKRKGKYSDGGVVVVEECVGIVIVFSSFLVGFVLVGFVSGRSSYELEAGRTCTS